MSSRKTFHLATPNIGDDERALVNEVLRSNRLSAGPMIERFEFEFAERFGARCAVAVSSGTAALHLSVITAGVEEGDLVITTPFSFIASANPILYERGIPVFVDIDPDSLTIDAAAAVDAMEKLVFRRSGWERLLPPRVASPPGKLRAIIPVDVFGRVAEMEWIVAAARALGISVIEDACEAIGASLDGVPAGRWGDTGTFAFYPNKQMTTGEGGLVLTDDEHRAAVMRSLRNQGRSSDATGMTFDRLGYNYRLAELSAAVGLAQLRRLDELLSKREAVASMYDERLRSVEGVAPLARPRAGMKVSWFVYMVRVDDEIDREELIARLAGRGIPTRAYFWPIHLQPVYRERFGFTPGMYRHAEAAGESLLALPFQDDFTADDIDFICETLAEEIAEGRAPSRRSLSPGTVRSS